MRIESPVRSYRLLSYIVMFLLTISCSEQENIPLTSSFVINKAHCPAPCTLQVENESLNATDYLWDFGDGFTSAAQIPTHIYNMPGTYTVQLKTINGSQEMISSQTIYVIDRQVCSTVNIFYVLPSDAVRTDRQNLINQAVEENRALWSRNGATFITEDVVTIHSNLTRHEFIHNDDGIHNNTDWNWLGNAINEVMANTDVVLNDPNHKNIIFLEADVSGFCPCAAAANFHFTGIPKWIIDRIERDFATEVGAIGHELGHTFGMPHENCGVQVAPKGIMCNGADFGFVGFPEVELRQWHFDFLFNAEHRSYFLEHCL